MGRKREDHVRLSAEERKLIKREMKNTTPTRATRCTILLQADENNSKNKNRSFTLEAISERSGASINTVRATIRYFLQEGLVKALAIERNPNSDNAKRKITVEDELFIVEKMKGVPPEGYCRWTITLLHNTIVKQLHDISRSSVGNIVKKYDLRPYIKKCWIIPPENDPEFVCCMEDVIRVYGLPYNPKMPVYCFDEKPFQLLDDYRKPIPMKEGNPEKVDSTYIRCGTVSISVTLDVNQGYIYHRVSPTRTAVDFAESLEWISDTLEKDADRIVLVLDNLNTHVLNSLYKAFPPEKAFRIAQRFELHYTPKHASWLDMAEIAINVMTKQCLGRKFSNIDILENELCTWEKVHNKAAAPFHWTFTVEKARVKLKRVYPDPDKYVKDRDDLRKKKKSNIDDNDE